MSYIRKPSIMEQLFGSDVPLWKKLLTLATFPIWGPLAVLVLAVLVLCAVLLYFACLGCDLGLKLLDNISDK